jgi:hypothetical protein
MSADWIKMRCNLWDDPRIARVCDETEQTEAAVVGAVYWLWATADQHSVDGFMPGLSLRQIDRKTGVPGFAQAMSAIGWITAQPDGVVIERFDEHNGASAKKRALTARRVAKHHAAGRGGAGDGAGGTGGPVGRGGLSAGPGFDICNGGFEGASVPSSVAGGGMAGQVGGAPSAFDALPLVPPAVVSGRWLAPAPVVPAVVVATPAPASAPAPVPAPTPASSPVPVATAVDGAPVDKPVSRFDSVDNMCVTTDSACTNAVSVSCALPRERERIREREEPSSSSPFPRTHGRVCEGAANDDDEGDDFLPKSRDAWARILSKMAGSAFAVSHRFATISDNWIGAGVSVGEMRGLVDAAQRSAGGPIGYMPGYVEAMRCARLASPSVAIADLVPPGSGMVAVIAAGGVVVGVGDDAPPPRRPANPADVARMTVPGRPGRDPVLVAIDRDAARAVPPPAAVRERLAVIRTQMADGDRARRRGGVAFRGMRGIGELLAGGAQ